MHCIERWTFHNEWNRWFVPGIQRCNGFTCTWILLAIYSWALSCSSSWICSSSEQSFIRNLNISNTKYNNHKNFNLPLFIALVFSVQLSDYDDDYDEEISMIHHSWDWNKRNINWNKQQMIKYHNYKLFNWNQMSINFTWKIRTKKIIIINKVFMVWF